jgi:hypothetical protein
MWARGPRLQTHAPLPCRRPPSPLPPPPSFRRASSPDVSFAGSAAAATYAASPQRRTPLTRTAPHITRRHAPHITWRRAPRTTWLRHPAAQLCQLGHLRKLGCRRKLGHQCKLVCHRKMGSRHWLAHRTCGLRRAGLRRCRLAHRRRLRNSHLRDHRSRRFPAAAPLHHGKSSCPSPSRIARSRRRGRSSKCSSRRSSTSRCRP